MTLKQQLESKIIELQSRNFPDEEEYRFFEFISKEILGSKDLSQVSSSDYLVALVALDGHEKFDTVMSTIADLYPYLNQEESEFREDITYLITIIYSLRRINLLDSLLALNHEPSPAEVENIINKYNPETDGVISGKKSPRLEVVACVSEYIAIGLSIFDNLDKIRSFVKMIAKSENIDDQFAKFINYQTIYQKSNFYKKHPLEIISSEMDYIYEAMDVNDTLKRISDRYYALSQNQKQFVKNINKQVTIYSKMIEILNALEDGQILNIKEDFFSKLDSSFLIVEFMKELLEHNRKNYSKLQVENIKRDKYHQTEKLFLENDIHLGILTEEERTLLLKNGQTEKLKEIILFLKKPEFAWLHINHPNYVQIILNTTPMILQTIIDLIQSEVISQEFVMSHIEILINENQIPVNEYDVKACYELFRTNISLLVQNTNYLERKIAKNESILFMDTETIYRNLELCKKYSLNLCSENAKLYGLNIVSDTQRFDELDQFIELGYRDYIQNNPQLLREESQDILTRLSIVTNIGLDPMNKENRFKGSITNGKNFYVVQERLDEYRILPVDEYVKNDDFDILKENDRMTISPSTEKLDIVLYLDNLFKVNDLEYQMNETIISRNKVLRNLECLLQHKDEYEESQIALSAIIYHSVIDNNTIEFIKEQLNEYNKDEVKKKTYKS